MTSVDTAVRLASAMVIDDSAVQRRHAAGLLRELGTAVVWEAEHGQQALDMLLDDGVVPEFILLDLEMAGVNGIAFLERMPHRNIPIALCSSREQRLIDSVQVLGADLGLRVVAALHKPLHLQPLVDAIEHSRVWAPPTAGQASGCTGVAISKAMLSEAIERRDFEVHYQPKVQMRTGRVSGVEALARWNHAQWGWMPPDGFVAAAERERTIGSLTRLVLEEAFTACAGWRRAGADLVIAVNLSPLLIDGPGFVPWISELAARCELPTRRIVLEITESSLARQQSKALANVSELRLLGFGVSIDDYGTGFSSLKQLARLPVTELKIDRSFIQGACRKPRQQTILKSALELARQLSLVSVAEGVEEREDWDLLARLGCDMVQGWMIAKAMPADQLLPWLGKSASERAALAGARRAAGLHLAAQQQL